VADHLSVALEEPSEDILVAVPHAVNEEVFSISETIGTVTVL
jgi:hypothetical protein